MLHSKHLLRWGYFVSSNTKALQCQIYVTRVNLDTATAREMEILFIIIQGQKVIPSLYKQFSLI